MGTNTSKPPNIFNPCKPITHKKTSLESIQFMESNINREYYNAQILKEWKKFSDCLSKENESIFIEMITRCYDSYHLAINSYNNIHNRKNANKGERQQRSLIKTTTSLFMALYLYQQKQLNHMKSNQRQLDFYV